MTTTTPTPTRTAAAEIPQTGDKRWNGPLDREDPQIEADSQYEEESFLDMITRTISMLHDWLAGPPMSSRDRVRHDITEHSSWLVGSIAVPVQGNDLDGAA